MNLATRFPDQYLTFLHACLEAAVGSQDYDAASMLSGQLQRLSTAKGTKTVRPYRDFNDAVLDELRGSSGKTIADVQAAIFKRFSDENRWAPGETLIMRESGGSLRPVWKERIYKSIIYLIADQKIGREYDEIWLKLNRQQSPNPVESESSFFRAGV